MIRLFFFAAIMIVFNASVYACTCSLGDVQQKFKSHPFVFLGTVSQVIRTGEKSDFGEDRIQVAFDVEKLWKGDPDQNELDTYDNKVSCEGYWFKEGLRYLVFSRKGKNGMTVAYCGGVIPDSGEVFEKHMEFMKQQPASDKNSQKETGGKTQTELPKPVFNSYPHWSPDGKRIVFSSDRSGRSELYLIGKDGKDLMQITSDEASHASWSPNGSMIAFDSKRDGNREIYVMKPDGTGVTRLTNNPAWDGSPFWSPDGEKLIFYSERDGNAEIYIIELETRKLTRVTDTPDQEYYASYSPDGNKLVMESKGDGEREIVVSDANGAGKLFVTKNELRDHLPAWSPDGKSILFTSRRDGNDDIYVMKKDGTEAKNLTRNSATDVMPKFSPDGEKIVFVSDRGGSFAVYIMNADGSGVEMLER